MMGAISDLLGAPIYGFILATGFAAMLCIGTIYNALRKARGCEIAHASEIGV